jgi:hypothetical protein
MDHGSPSEESGIAPGLFEFRKKRRWEDKRLRRYADKKMESATS